MNTINEELKAVQINLENVSETLDKDLAKAQRKEILGGIEDSRATLFALQRLVGYIQRKLADLERSEKD